LVPIEVHYGEKSWNVFIKNLHFFSTEERMDILDDMGWVNQQKFFQKWTTPWTFT